MTKIRIGVIGSGVFGRYHALKCQAHPNVILTGIHSPETGQGRRLAREVGAAYFAKPNGLIETSDALIIACPAIYHAEHAMKCLAAGQHILIEKPMTTNVDDARQIIALAESKKLIIQIGHQERFVLRVIGLDRVPEKPVEIRAHRMSPYSERGTDTSVTLDLMSHDLDLVLWLMGEAPIEIQGMTQTVRSSCPDAALGCLQFENARAWLEASRVEVESSRKMQIRYPSGTVHIDFNAKTVEHDTGFDLNAGFASHPDAKDSLAAGLNEFVSAIAENRSSFINGQAGLAVVEASLEIDKNGFGR